ncbi:YbaB/EbfC family nucleoid-associated protein [Microbacterium sp. ARD32]|uniref:YbaB/EbfC family nucleoid-associated protein n=1 Tax=Microbacterium sp. ARD32 TaxID=2962577 RepID=UPI0028819466|nr:YbaB/EbfC family nucleoid-associated protein [Microbacterium sp. ARD32]MDT0156249.1 YbaB/EbfC family nucleoid-associated protein [Microbacterium sp. ARD32]
MEAEELEAVLARGFEVLREAQDGQALPLPSDSRGSDRDGLVEIVLDGHGILKDVTFSDEVGDLSPSELESALLEAQQDAIRASGRGRVQDLPDIGSSEVDEQARRLFGMEGE